MKPKDFCQECGKFMCRKKLKKNPKDGRLLCGGCFSRIAGIKLKKEPIVPIMNNVSEKVKKELREAKIRKKCNYIGRSDVDFLKDKYGIKAYKQILKLKNYFGEQRMKDVLDESESNDRQKREEELNKRFKESFK